LTGARLEIAKAMTEGNVNPPHSRPLRPEQESLIPLPHDIRFINKATGTVAIRIAAVPAALT